MGAESAPIAAKSQTLRAIGMAIAMLTGMAGARRSQGGCRVEDNRMESRHYVGACRPGGQLDSL
jgi:hypothetical protein